MSQIEGNMQKDQKPVNIVRSQSYQSSDDIVESNNGNKKHFVYDSEIRKQRLEGGTKWRDVLVVLCAGFALISDGYQNNVMTMLNLVFPELYPKAYDAEMKTAVSNASLVGTIFGQIAIGFTCDYIGRKWSIVVATCFLILGTVMCAASHGVTTDGMFWMLIISRGVTGFGIGAEYPASSVSANEAANESMKRRGGAFTLCTNLPLSFGGPFAIIIFLIVYQITKGVDSGLWRTMFAIGAFWPLSVFYFRVKMATSELYKKSAIKRRVPYWLAFKYYWPRLLGTCGCWFLYDFVTFPNGVFSGGIIQTILGDTDDLEKVAEWQLLLGIIAIPGVFVGAYLCDKIGRKYTLIIGFCGYIIFGLIVGIAYNKLKNIPALFVIFYGLMMSSGNLGPGDMMGLVSLESFATPIRATCYGFSAAIGKVGAVVGTKTFTPIQTNLPQGERWTFIIAAICGLSGVLVAFFLIPHLKEDDLLEEDIKFKNYLIDHGWDGEFGLQGEPSKDEELQASSDDDDPQVKVL